MSEGGVTIPAEATTLTQKCTPCLKDGGVNSSAQRIKVVTPPDQHQCDISPSVNHLPGGMPMAVKVICGVNELTSESYSGRSVDDVRRELKTPLNIAEGAEARLNDEAAEGTTVLRSGDELEFVKQSGEKGGE